MILGGDGEPHHSDPWPQHRPQFLAAGRRQIVRPEVAHAVNKALGQGHRSTYRAAGRKFVACRKPPRDSRSQIVRCQPVARAEGARSLPEGPGAACRPGSHLRRLGRARRAQRQHRQRRTAGGGARDRACRSLQAHPALRTGPRIGSASHWGVYFAGPVKGQPQKKLTHGLPCPPHARVDRRRGAKGAALAACCR